MTPKEKVNILMVDDQPAKVMSYEAILADLDENLLKATFRERSAGNSIEKRNRRGFDGREHAGNGWF